MVPKPRRSGRPLQGVKTEREALVLELRVRPQRWSASQRRDGYGRSPAGGSFAGAGDELGEGLLPRRRPRRRGHGLVVRPRTNLTGELQVALELAVQLPFDDLVRDLHGHDPPRIPFPGALSTPAVRSIVLETSFCQESWRLGGARLCRPGERPDPLRERFRSAAGTAMQDAPHPIVRCRRLVATSGEPS